MRVCFWFVGVAERVRAQVLPGRRLVPPSSSAPHRAPRSSLARARPLPCGPPAHHSLPRALPLRGARALCCINCQAFPPAVPPPPARRSSGLGPRRVRRFGWLERVVGLGRRCRRCRHGAPQGCAVAGFRPAGARFRPRDRGVGVLQSARRRSGEEIASPSHRAARGLRGKRKTGPSRAVSSWGLDRASADGYTQPPCRRQAVRREDGIRLRPSPPRKFRRADRAGCFAVGFLSGCRRVMSSRAAGSRPCGGVAVRQPSACPQTMPSPPAGIRPCGGDTCRRPPHHLAAENGQLVVVCRCGVVAVSGG